MSQIQKPTRIRDGHDVTKVLEQDGWDIRRANGSHIIARKEEIVITYHDHHEYAPGIRNHLVKMLLKAGLLVAILIFVLIIVH